MASMTPDIEILVGNTGGASPSGESASLIRNNLQQAFSKTAADISLTVSSASIDKMREQLRKQLSGITIDVGIGASKGTGSRGGSATGSVGSSGGAKSSEGVRDYSKQNLAWAQKELFALETAYNRVVTVLNQNNLTPAAAGLGQLAATFEAAKAQIEALGQSATQILPVQRAEITASVAEIRSAFTVVQQAQKILRDAPQKLNSFNAYLKTLQPQALKNNAAQIASIQTGLQSGDVKRIQEATVAMQAFRTQMKLAGHEGGNIFTLLRTKVRQFVAYTISARGFMMVIRSIKAVITSVKELDAAMTDLRIITGGSKTETEKLLKTYNSLAKTLGSTTVSVAEGAVGWLRQGYNTADTEELLKQSSTLSIVGNMESSEATTALTAALKGYRLEVSQASSVVDKFFRIDMAAATSSTKMAEALSKTAANAKLAGLSLDDVIGQLAVINSTMQESGEETGTFYNTMLSRMGNIKAGRLDDPESGDDLSNVETTLRGLDIDLRDQAGQFRNFGEVLDEVGSRWNSFSTTQQRAIATAFAGTRQQTRFLALMQGWEDAGEYAELAANSTGVAAQKMALYQESVEAKANKAKASMEAFSSAILDSDLVGFFYDASAAVLDFGAGLSWLIKPALLLGAAFFVFPSIFTMIKASGIGAAFAQTGQSLASILPTLSALGNATGGVVTNNALLAASYAQLTPQQIAAAASMSGLDVATLSTTLQTAGFNCEQRKEIISLWTDIQAKKKAAGATLGFAGAEGAATGATWSLSTALKGLGKVIQAHPILAILTGIAAVAVAVAGAVDLFTYSQEEQNEALSEACQQYDNVTQELSSLRSELDQVRAKMKELESSKIDLNASEEYSELKLLNDELEREIRLKEREAKIAAEDKEKTAVKNATTKQKIFVGQRMTRDGAYVDITESVDDVDYLNRTIDLLEANRQQRSKVLIELEKAQNNGDSAMANMLKQEVVDLDNEYASLYDQASEAARNNQDLAASISGVTAEGRVLKPELEESVERWLDYADGVDLATASLEEAIVQQEAFASMTSRMGSDMDALAEAQSDMADMGYLSADSIQAMREAGLDEYLVASRNGYKLTADAMQDYLKKEEAVYQSAITTARQAAIAVIDNEEAKARAINATTQEIRDQLQAQLSQLEADRQAALAIAEAEQDSVAIYLINAAYEKSIRETKKALSDLNTATANFDEFKRWSATTQRDYSQGGGSSGEAKDKNKADFEEEYAKQKHALDTEQITLKEFNEWLDGNDGYKKYFSDRTKYADEWRKYEKEVFDNSMKLHDQDLADIDHKIEMLKLQNASEQEILDTYREREKLLKSARSLVYDFLKGQGLTEEQIASNSTLQELDRSILENANDATDFHKERVDARIADFEHEISMLKKRAKSEDLLISKYREEQKYLVEVREAYRQTLIAAGKTADEIAEDAWFQQLTQQIGDLDGFVCDALQSVFDRTSESLNGLLELTEELIRHEAEEQVEALEEQKDAFSDIIDAKKEILRLTKEEQSYNDKVAKSTKEIAKLQARIDALAMDDSRQAALERAKLEEELAEKQKELSDTQNDHYIDKTEEALDKEEESYHDLMDSKIKEVENFLDDNEAVTKAALARLDNANEQLFDDLFTYAKKYTDTTGAELQSMWDEAMASAQTYGSFTASLGMHDDSDSYKARSLVAEMQNNGVLWGQQTTDAGRKIYEDANVALGYQISNILGADVWRENGTWYIRENGKTRELYDAYGYDSNTSKVQSLVAEMKSNGAKWGKQTTDAGRKIYEDANVVLGQQVSDILGVPVWRENGTWYISQGGKTKKLYDVYSYHTGGVVGSTGSVSPKADELFALLQKDEVVMSRQMVDNAHGLLTSLPKIVQTPIALAAAAAQKVRKFILNVSAPLTIDGVLPSEEILSTIKQYPRKVAEVVASELQKL